MLLYSTCTVLRAENEDVVNAFLADDGEFAPEGFNVGGVSEPSGMHCFWPNVDGTDGFFAAKLRRIKCRRLCYCGRAFDILQLFYLLQKYRHVNMDNAVFGLSG